MTDDVVQVAFHYGKAKEGLPDAEHTALSLAIETIQRDFNAALFRAVETLEKTGDYDVPLGKFKDAEPVEGECEAPKFEAVGFSHGEVPERDSTIDDGANPDALAANFYNVTWSDIVIDLSYESLGTFFEGKVTIEQQCGVVTYDVRAVHVLPCLSDADCKILHPTVKLTCNKEDEHWGVPGSGTCWLK